MLRREGALLVGARRVVAVVVEARSRRSRGTRGCGGERARAPRGRRRRSPCALVADGARRRRTPRVGLGRVRARARHRGARPSRPSAIRVTPAARAPADELGRRAARTRRGGVWLSITAAALRRRRSGSTLREQRPELADRRRRHRAEARARRARAPALPERARAAARSARACTACSSTATTRRPSASEHRTLVELRPPAPSSLASCHGACSST